jgi:hypothetical protein
MFNCSRDDSVLFLKVEIRNVTIELSHRLDCTGLVGAASMEPGRLRNEGPCA